jgi:D-alanine-D-alanine ligase-like ATP-grasp enzyme
VLEQRLPLAPSCQRDRRPRRDSAMVQLPVQQNLHRDGILAVTQVPAPDVDAALQAEAVAAARRLAEGMGYVGVLCVEFFVADKTAAGGQRDGAAPAQLGPLQHRRLRRVAVRAAGALPGRPAAGGAAPALARP